ncbi:response regulator [Tropicibacter sp. S64]|uniref:hybrid sensor histidine kinase/response regulator n=1 Tax=Tropicibacter sp. S64 TaxID=3415122 RepID=UPI003C7A7F02
MPAETRTEPLMSAETFASRYSRSALFDRYARARIRTFWQRQVATLIGSSYIAFFVSMDAALAATLLAVCGEGFEMILLRVAQTARRRGVGLSSIIGYTTFGAAVQALTITCCVILLVETAPNHEAELVALCFLMAAAVNAGYALTHHPPASKVKLGIYGACACAFVLFEARSDGETGHRLVTHVIEVALLSYLTQNFVSVWVRSFQRRMENERALIDGAEQLSTVNRELEIREREMRNLSFVARHANDSVILFKPNLDISWVNDSFVRLTGFSREEVVGRKPWEVLEGPDSVPEGQRDEIETLVRQPVLKARLLNYTKDGQKIWVEVNRVPVFGPGGTIETLVSIERDVTDLVRHEEEMAQARMQAEEGARAKSAFLATMSHEMRTPLNAIVGMADLLAAEDLGSEQNEYVGIIQSASISLLTIINDVLDYSRLEADKVEIERRPHPPAQVIEDAVRLLRAMAEDKGLTLDVRTDGTLPDIALFDSSRMRQILVNLIGNAVKFTDFGCVTVLSSAEAAGDGWTMRVEVRDTGVGVPPDRAEHIFGKFQQADAATTRRFGGTGLGLPISQSLAQRMGGHIRLLPAPEGGGSAFEVCIALGRPGPEDIVPTAQQADFERQLTRRMRVLLAEDNATNRLLVKRCLKDQPVELFEAINGREAVEMTLEFRPDVIFMDMSMPELDGVSATRIIRTLEIPQPHIAALTANAFESDRETCAKAGMDDFITKPLRRKDLITALVLAERGEKPLSTKGETGVSRLRANNEADTWTSPPASGTTNGKSIRSSGR